MKKSKFYRMNKHIDVIKNNNMISVIIPVFNAEQTIIAALNSIMIQTEGCFEIIVINDGSTDNSLKQILSFKLNYPQTNIVIIDKKHEGVSATRNMGLKLATGNYIAFLDADDEWHPEKTTKQLSVFKNTAEADFIGCLYKPKHDHSLKKNNTLVPVKSKDLLFNHFFQTSTVVMKKHVFDSIGYFEKSKSFGEERHYFLRVSTLFSCLLLNEKLINYGSGKRGFGQSGLSANIFQLEAGELKNLIYAYKVLNMPLFICCNAIIFSIAKFIRRLYIVYVLDVFKKNVYARK